MSKQAMSFRDYAGRAAATAIYPREQAGVYPALGLAGEVGELLHVEAFIGVLDARTEKLKSELGDVIWYVAASTRDRGIPLAEPLNTPPRTIVGLEDALRHLAVLAGEVAQLEKRRLRDGTWDAGKAGLVAAGLIDALKNICRAYDLSLADCAEENVAKLAGRAARGTLHGAGER